MESTNVKNRETRYEAKARRLLGDSTGLSLLRHLDFFPDHLEVVGDDILIGPRGLNGEHDVYILRVVSLNPVEISVWNFLETVSVVTGAKHITDNSHCIEEIELI